MALSIWSNTRRINMFHCIWRGAVVVEDVSWWGYYFEAGPSFWLSSYFSTKFCYSEFIWSFAVGHQGHFIQLGDVKCCTCCNVCWHINTASGLIRARTYGWGLVVWINGIDIILCRKIFICSWKTECWVGALWIFLFNTVEWWSIL